MAVTQVFPQTVFLAGRQQTGDLPVADGDTVAQIEVDVTLFTDPAVTVSFGVDISLDAGTTWQLVVSGARPGGALINARTGLPYTMMSVRHPDIPAGAGRLIRAWIDVVGGPVTLGPATLTTA